MLFNTIKSHTKFHGTLIALNEDLGCEKLLDIIFLLRDHYSGDHARFAEPVDVFQELLDKGLINERKPGLLVETIWRIGRKDLVKKYLVRDVIEYERHVQESSLFTPYRYLFGRNHIKLVDIILPPPLIGQGGWDLGGHDLSLPPPPPPTNKKNPDTFFNHRGLRKISKKTPMTPSHTPTTLPSVLLSDG